MKRILAVFLALVALFAFSAVPALAEGYNGDDTDFAVALGIILEDEIDSAQPLTRIELAEIFYNIVFHGQENTNEYWKEKDFPDVPQEKKHIAATVFGMGVMRGYSDTVFAPGDAVTHNQAVKALISFLGYDIQAERLGGYPSGYLSQAARLKILPAENISGDAKITYAGFCSMLKKAINVDVAIWNNIMPDGTAVNDILEGTGYLEYYRGIKVLNGKVTGNYLTGTDEEISYFGVYINDTEKIEVSEKAQGLQELLGYDVYIYYTEDGNTKTALYFEEGINNVLEISDSSIAGVSKGNIRYYDDNSDAVSEVSFAYNAALIYNGTLETSYSAEDINPFANGNLDGSIKLIDAGKDGVYETIVVNAFQSVVVEDVRNNKIYGMYSATGNNADKVIDVTNYKERNIDIININGQISDLSALRKGYVANICRDKNGVVKRIVITKDSMTGVIEEIAYSGGKISSIKIGGAEFDVSKNLIVVDHAGKIKSGVSAVIFFNCQTKVAFIDLESQYVATYSKGLLVDAGTFGGLEKASACMIYDAEGKMNEFSLAEKIVYNGTITDAAEVVENFGKVGNRVKRQVILYKLDSEGKVVTAIELPKELAEGESTFEGFYKYPGTSFTYNIGYKSFSDTYLVTDDTLIFTYPDENYRDDYQRYGKLTLPTGEGTSSYTIDLFGMSKAGMAVDMGAVKMAFGGGGGDSSRRPYFIVSKVTNAIDEDGENCIKVSGHYMNGITFYSGAFTIKESVFAQGDLNREGKKPFLDQSETMFAPGDIYTVPDFSNGGVVHNIDTTQFYQVYDYDDNAFMNATGYATTTDRKYYIGKVVYRDDSSVKIQILDGTYRSFQLKSGAFRFVEVTKNPSNGELSVKPSTYEAILSEETHPGEGSTVIIHGRGMGIGCYIYNVKR